ncbi:hypothetical protein MTR67_038958 [Solanum verrucosum]|uniref:Integrase zinc-binding domain-containing protein n=1 Tax=Solanum verrucosum TaxID=315347 RepID=A0AAF0ZPZ2_SOLVR|nr:hypothetical protein MTR67_038958 [Solanum verrucosum]
MYDEFESKRHQKHTGCDWCSAFSNRRLADPSHVQRTQDEGQKCRGGWGNSNAGRGPVPPGKEVARQDDKAQFYAFSFKNKAGSSNAVITGMTWLSSYYVLLNFNNKFVTLEIPGREKLQWEGVYKPKPAKIISSIRDRKLAGQGCLAYLAHIRDVKKKGGVLASIEVRATFIEEIKDKLFEDENLNELRKKTVIGKAKDMVLYAGGMLNFKGRICVPIVGDLIQNFFTESHGLRYSVHPGVPKMYRDLKRLYWWSDMKKVIA